MKKLLVFVIVMVLLVTCSVPVFAAKDKVKTKGAQKIDWNLSGDVMPVPPYGGVDIIGSDIASKLIVNQPKGKVVANINGIMRGLLPNTEYTVFLSNGYIPYSTSDWNVAGNWVINFRNLGIDYAEDLVLTQEGTDITGVSLELVGGGSPWTIESGSITGDNISFTGYFNANPLLHIVFTGVIAADGSMSGTWADVAPGTRSGTWASTSGAAIKQTGSTTWPGFFNDTVPAFTFTTNIHGNANWHINLKKEDIPEGKDIFSIWINGGGATILIGDPVIITE